MTTATLWRTLFLCSSGRPRLQRLRSLRREGEAAGNIEQLKFSLQRGHTGTALTASAFAPVLPSSPIPSCLIPPPHAPALPLSKHERPRPTQLRRSGLSLAFHAVTSVANSDTPNAPRPSARPRHECPLPPPCVPLIGGVGGRLGCRVQSGEVAITGAADGTVTLWTCLRAMTERYAAPTVPRLTKRGRVWWAPLRFPAVPSPRRLLAAEISRLKRANAARRPLGCSTACMRRAYTGIDLLTPRHAQVSAAQWSAAAAGE